MTNGNGMPPEVAPPQLNVLAQYTKDLSLENPNAPASLGPQAQQPAINIQINVNANNVAENEYEVALLIEGKAENDGKVLFSFDLTYAGVFRIVNVPQENLHPMIMIECPRLLFPFAREIIATAVRDGGFPPLMLDPVDFVGLYRQNIARQAAVAQGAQVKPSYGDFTDAMLHWPAGPRASGGVWAKYWYDAVIASTGFAEYQPRPVALTGAALVAAEDSRPHYERLHAVRVVLTP